jgi:hypothetical protein
MFKDQKNLYVVKIMKIIEHNDITTHFLTVFTNRMINTKGFLDPDQSQKSKMDITRQSMEQNKIEELSEVIFKMIRANHH